MKPKTIEVMNNLSPADQTKEAVAAVMKNEKKEEKAATTIAAFARFLLCEKEEDFSFFVVRGVFSVITGAGHNK